MSDQSRIMTGFDCEFLIGGDYLSTIFQAAYVNGRFLNREALENPLNQVILEAFGVSITSYDIGLRGTILNDTFQRAIPGISATVSEELFNYLAGQLWLLNDTLVNDFDPNNAELDQYLEENFSDHKSEIIELLANAYQQADMHIGAPYHAEIFDDSEPVFTAIRRPLSKITAGRIAEFVDHLKANNWVDSEGRLIADLEVIKGNLEAWLSHHIEDYAQEIMLILEQPHDLQVHVPIQLVGEHLSPDGSMKLFDRLNEVILFVAVEITPYAILLNNPMVSQDSIAVLNEWGEDLDRENFGEGLAQFIGTILPERFDMDLTPNDQVQHIEYKKLPSREDYAPAYGMYFNVSHDLRILPAPPPGYSPTYEIEAQSRPINMTGETIDLSDEGYLIVKDQNGIEIPHEDLLYGPDIEQPNHDSILVRVIGNRNLMEIGVDENGHLFAVYISGHRPTPEEIIELAEKNPPRGDTSRACSYLRPDRDFVIGISKSAVERYELSIWNSFWQPLTDETRAMLEQMQAITGFPPSIPDGSRPVIDETKENKPVVGSYKHLSLRVEEDYVQLIVKMEFDVDWWPDPEVFCKAKLTPWIEFEGGLSIMVGIEELDVDSGILGDLLAFLIGGLLFSALGPVGAIGGATMGVVALEVAESVVEDFKKGDVRSMIQSQIGQLFEAIPSPIPLFFREGDDIAYFVTDGPTQVYQEAEVNSDGILLTGQGGFGKINTPHPVNLIDRERAPDFALTHLVYANAAGETAEILSYAAQYRIQENSLKKVTLTPVAQCRRGGRIHSLKFNSGVDLQISEIIEFIRTGVIFIPRVKIRISKSGHEYLQSLRDNLKSNNLSELPTFKPREL
jgi:hypothetical protein